jgi:hypothetical protein
MSEKNRRPRRLILSANQPPGTKNRRGLIINFGEKSGPSSRSSPGVVTRPLRAAVGISAEELAALNTALKLMQREAMAEPRARLETLSSKLWL